MSRWQCVIINEIEVKIVTLYGCNVYIIDCNKSVVTHNEYHHKLMMLIFVLLVNLTLNSTVYLTVHTLPLVEWQYITD